MPTEGIVWLLNRIMTSSNKFNALLVGCVLERSTDELILLNQLLIRNGNVEQKDTHLDAEVYNSMDLPQSPAYNYISYYRH